MNRTCVRLSFLSMIGLAVTGCVGDVGSESDVNDSENPVINGTTDQNDPAVVMLWTQGQGYCSGTLVSPTVVVTASHCVDGITAQQVGFGLNGTSNKVNVKSTKYHPNWNGNNLENGYDVAVVILATAVTNVTPIAISGDVSEARHGDPIKIVGYGNNTTGSGTGFGTKRQASLNAATISSSDGVSESKFIKAYNSAGTQTCNGDSGGPVFHTDASGVQHLVGVTSFGYTGCTGGSFHTRVAAYTSFLSQYVTIGGNNGGGGTGDTQAPSISLSSPSNGSTLTSGQRSIVFTATDNVGVADVVLNWAYNGKTISCANPDSAWTCSVSGSKYTFTANIGTGTRNFTATATDAAGNSKSTGSLSITLQ